MAVGMILAIRMRSSTFDRCGTRAALVRIVRRIEGEKSDVRGALISVTTQREIDRKETTRGVLLRYGQPSTRCVDIQRAGRVTNGRNRILRGDFALLTIIDGERFDSIGKLVHYVEILLFG